MNSPCSVSHSSCTGFLLSKIILKLLIKYTIHYKYDYLIQYNLSKS